MIIVWITWTLGAGKGTIVEYLVQHKGFIHYSVRAFLIEEIEKQGMPINRDAMVHVGNELRAEHGSSYIVEQLYEQARSGGRHAIIESIRNPGEVQALKAKAAQENGDFTLLAIDADPKIRYERIMERGSETDQVGYQEFIMNEQREMTNTDPNKQNVGACIALADYTFINNGTLEELHEQIEKMLAKIHI